MAKYAIEGLDEVMAKLEKLGQAEQNRSLRKGLTLATAEVRKEATARAKKLDNPKTPNKIFQNIKSKAWKIRRGRPYLGASVIVDNKKGKGGDAYYWRFVEFGTKNAKAKPFMQPALEAKEKQAVELMKKGAAEMIEKIAKGV